LGAGLIALLASLPGLALPFMSDDWINPASAVDGWAARTPFGYFRPLYLASFRVETHLWGLQSAAFHATNALMIAASAVVVVLVVRRFTGDSSWAVATGVLFALHPYHVENAAWIAARADVAATALMLLAALAYDDWVRRERGLPWLALVLFWLALLFKESVALFPAMIWILRRAVTGTPLARTEWLKGILPLGFVAGLHFIFLRPAFLHASGLDPLESFGGSWLKRGIEYFAAAVVPAHAEYVETHPIVCAIAAAATLAVLAWVARRHLRAGAVAAVIVLFVASLLPSALSFQERYLFLASVVGAAALAYLLLRSPRRFAIPAGSALVVLWITALGAHWSGWLEAGKASRQLVAGLTEASRRVDIREVVLANQPYRVAGAPLAGDLHAAVMLSGGRSISIRAATALNLPEANDSGISAEPRVTPLGAELFIRIPQAVFSGVFLPLRRTPNSVVDEGFAVLSFDDGGGVSVRIPRSDDGTRAAYVWRGGRLVVLF